MFSDEDIKPIHDSFGRRGDEIISIREVCLNDKYDKKDLEFHNEALLSTSNRNDLDVSRSLFRDGFFPDGLEPQQARFAWTEEDGNIATLVSEHGFGTTSQTTFGKDLDAAFKSEMKEADTSSSVLEPISCNGINFTRKPFAESQLVSSTSTGNFERAKGSNAVCKVDKADPRSRVHYVKYVKRHGRTVKLWECGICSREFQHQYTLMRHLPTHTDERNFHCTVCGKSFRQLSTLSQHRAIHSAEKPYACEVCNKTFNRVSTLISHRKTHSDEKPYRCHLCPKGFHQKGNLRNHLFTHTNERPYRCNICLKGFNQQSNLVCHKNKAHPDENMTNVLQKSNLPQVSRSATDTQTAPSRNAIDHCEVSSTVGPYLPPVEQPSDFCIKLAQWDIAKRYIEQNGSCNESPWSAIGGGGVIVDPIKTYHMGVALATKQTPFALLKPDNCDPVLVKVVDTKLPGGKQMLVPATAEDLRTGGKLVLKKENDSTQEIDVESEMKISQAVQIRVPVVAIVVPRIKHGQRLHLTVEEPHHAYHTALSSDGAITMDPCTFKTEPRPGSSDVLPDLEPRSLGGSIGFVDRVLKTDAMSSSCDLSPPALSPPFDFISMDLFEPMECIPLGPQITAVDNINQPPPSDDSDIFIGEFQESIQLSDSD